MKKTTSDAGKSTTDNKVAYTPPSEVKQSNNSWIWWLVGCCGCSLILIIAIVVVGVAFGFYSFSQVASEFEDLSNGDFEWDYSYPDDYDSDYDYNYDDYSNMTDEEWQKEFDKMMQDLENYDSGSVSNSSSTANSLI